MSFKDIIGHERPKALLQAAIRHDRIAHAYLFYGEAGIGKRLTAMCFAKAANCETGSDANDPDACGLCVSCRQIASLTHPDFTLIEPDSEQATPQIRIEQIRELEQQIVYRPLMARLKVCLIDQADRLTIGAANALLKTLEEPPAHCLFLLVTSRPFALPGTVRSRCQALRFALAAQTQVEATIILKREVPPSDARFLAVLSEGRIGQALETDLSDVRAKRKEFMALLDPKTLQSVSTLLAAAETLAKADRASEALAWIARWLRDVMLVGVGADPCSLLNLDQHPALEALAAKVEVDALADLLADLESMERHANRNLNLQMALESVLLRLRDAVMLPAEPATAR